MANEEHLALLKEGIQLSWNKWRAKNFVTKPDLSEANLSQMNLNEADLNGVNFCRANLSDASLSRANISAADLSGVNLSKANLSRANLIGAVLIEANLNDVDLSGANLSRANLSSADLRKANLNGVVFIETTLYKANLSGLNFTKAAISRANLTEVNLSEANLSKLNFNSFDLRRSDFTNANLTNIQALETNFTGAILTGACIEDWHINSGTNLANVVCDFVYLSQGKQERRPSSGNFAYGEFAQLFQKSLETLDLIFRNGINWDAFAYSFKKLEIENQGGQLDVQSIEKKGDGILVVRVTVAPDANKAKIHGDFMQGYEFAAKALEAQYQERLEDKQKVINQLFSTINQQNKLLAQTGNKVSIYYQPNSQFAGGIVDANNVDADQIGGNIQNNDV
ncbi:pentapeptide repeat-containing protein [Nostoc sp. UCD121]|uniref:pentapeptide repeat-containing protein n=1 Tax=unclassified Nostoc TaxID=2593658 RepID=UPI0016283B76|nr:MULTISPECIES: pentapeptide repeat-containing protein [unclassified Nostoc]MBC1224580.1 pentapeptide repeat-containing protein [Nostoc sp. UCD120]MBC1281015.1 pentapeptide repeat-containing protein [Nostoc sp. UCD121]MBC1299774.1 pentapeptide repeat-containing protein [Nostoc sp. UCD122]